MARLNIEDEFFFEVTAVAYQTGVNPDTLTGNAMRFFRYAQEKHKQGKYIADDEFVALGFMAELFPMFARRSDSGIECAGADRFFNWLSAKVEAGRRGGEVCSDAKKEAARLREQKKRDLKIIDENHKQPEASISKSQQAQPSSSSSFSKELNTAETAKPKRQQKVFKPKSVEELRAGFDAKTIALWKELYPDDGYRHRESLKAFDHYVHDNPHKTPTTLTGWKRALQSWFERGWARHIAGVPSNGPHSNKNAPLAIRYPSAESLPLPPPPEQRDGGVERANEIRKAIAAIPSLSDAIQRRRGNE